ncbi:carboxypeptidase regulatory-like domain-containing protein [bacterium]|nr:carboxypeptidase regulatory-like domain-containing protein [bacterium]
MTGTVILELATLGCGGAATAKALDLEPVSGMVKFDGKPFAGASVAFMPRGTTAGQVAVSVTDAEGKFEMVYPDGGKGVPVGEYKVYISKLLTPSGDPIPEGKTAADVEAKDIVPMRYKKPDDLINVVSIPAGGKSDLVIEIMSK